MLYLENKIKSKRSKGYHGRESCLYFLKESYFTNSIGDRTHKTCMCRVMGTLWHTNISDKKLLKTKAPGFLLSGLCKYKNTGCLWSQSTSKWQLWTTQSHAERFSCFFWYQSLTKLNYFKKKIREGAGETDYCSRCIKNTVWQHFPSLTCCLLTASHVV